MNLKPARTMGMTTIKVNEPEAEAMDASERGQERVQVKKKG